MGLSVCKHLPEGAAKGTAVFCFQNQVEAVDAFEPGDGCGDWAEDANFIQAGGGEPTAKGIGPGRCFAQRLSLHNHICKDCRGRVMHPAAILEFLGDEPGVVVRCGALNGVVFGVISLDEDAAGKLSTAGAA